MKKHVFPFALALVAAFCIAVVPAAGVFADTAQQDICSGAGGSSSGNSCTTSGPSVNDVFATIINVFSAIIGAVAVMMLIYGGFQLTTGGNDPGKVKTGRSIIAYALVGLVVVAVAQFLVQFVLHRVGAG